MASNAVSATIAMARKMAANPATAKVPVTLQSIATAAGYPGKQASSVRNLARANGNGAQANGQTRYAPNVPAQWVALLTGAHAALAPTATKPVQNKARTQSAKRGWLGKQGAAAKQGAGQAKRQAKRAATPEPTAQATPTPEPTAQGS